jgi:hypothetical protein
MKNLKLWLYPLFYLLLLTSCKSAGGSKLDTIYFNKGEKSYFVNYESSMFQIYSCRSNAELDVALDAAGDIAKAKELCHESVTIVTPMAMKDAIADELSGPASDDLVGTKTERLMQLTAQIQSINLTILDFEDDFKNTPSDTIAKMFAEEIAKLKLQLKAIGDEVGRLSAALNDPAQLKEIDINSTLSLQSQIANTVDDRAAIFTAMLRDIKVYRLDPKRDSIMIKILDRFPLSCQPNVETAVRKKIRIGIEEIEYECQANAEAKVLATTCALSGYERIQNYCLFTGKGLTLKNIVATHSGVCAVSEGLNISCWGEPGKFPMVENSFNEGSNTIGRNLPTTRKAVSSLAASGRHLCSLNDQGVVIRCWTNVADVPGGSVQFSQIVGGDAHFCGINSDAKVICWGESAYKQNAIPADLTKVKSVATTENNSCAIDGDNRLVCWGDVLNSKGASPLATPSDLGEVNSVSVGTRHICSILKNNTVRCWGNNDFSQSTVPALVKDARLVAAGYYESCSVSLNGALQCWGQRSSKDYIQGPSLTDVKSIFSSRLGSNFCAVYGPESSVACWGKSYYTSAYSLTPPSDLKGVKDIVITASGYACAVTASNSVRCWGNTSLIPTTVPDALIIKN